MLYLFLKETGKKIEKRRGDKSCGKQGILL
jgi:hypothetical protein